MILMKGAVIEGGCNTLLLMNRAVAGWSSNWQHACLNTWMGGRLDRSIKLLGPTLYRMILKQVFSLWISAPAKMNMCMHLKPDRADTGSEICSNNKDTLWPLSKWEGRIS